MIKDLVEKGVTEEEIQEFEEKRIEQRNQAIIGNRLKKVLSDKYDEITELNITPKEIRTSSATYTKYRKYADSILGKILDVSLVKQGILANYASALWIITRSDELKSIAPTTPEEIEQAKKEGIIYILD